jgi:hypothetical protein
VSISGSPLSAESSIVPSTKSPVSPKIPWPKSLSSAPSSSGSIVAPTGSTVRTSSVGSTSAGKTESASFDSSGAIDSVGSTDPSTGASTSS